MNLRRESALLQEVPRALARPLFQALRPSHLCLPTAQYLQGLCGIRAFWRSQHLPGVVGTQNTDVRQTALSSMAGDCVLDLASPVPHTRWTVFARPHPLSDLKVRLCPKASEQPQQVSPVTGLGDSQLLSPCQLHLSEGMGLYRLTHPTVEIRRTLGPAPGGCCVFLG